MKKKKVAVAIMCKTPAPGASKTRLSPPLQPEECAAISACFIRDLADTIHELVSHGDVAACAVYTPTGSEPALRALLHPEFTLTAQHEGDFGVRLMRGTHDLLEAGHAGAILVNSDSPTLPMAILRQAVDAVLAGDNVTLSPAHDGGYTLIGLSRLHTRLFEDIPWSTSEVYRLTLDRAREIGLPVVNVPGWYDVDDAQSFQMLQDELAGKPISLAGQPIDGRAMTRAKASATTQFLNARRPDAAAPN